MSSITSAGGNRADHTEQIVEDAHAVTLKLSDTVDAKPRPSDVASYYVEDEYDERAEQQRTLLTHEGHAAAEPHQRTARALAPTAAGVDFVLALAKLSLGAAQEQWRRAERVLRPLVRRPAHAKATYYFFLAAFLLGDVAGIAGAQILRGEVPSLAVAQAVSAAAATVAAGFVGRDLRDLERHRYRARRPELLGEGLADYQHLFQGRHDGGRLVGRMVVLAAAMAVFLGVGVFALRGSVEGALGGLVYAMLAVAIAGGSALNAWCYADDVADLLDGMGKQVRAAERRVLTLARDKDVRRRNDALEAARSIHVQHQALGRAAWRLMRALKLMILRENPQVAGHGRTVPQTMQGELFGDVDTELALLTEDRP